MRGWRKCLAALLVLGLPLAACDGSAGHIGVQVHRETAAPGDLSAAFPGRDPMLRWEDAGSLHVLYVEDGSAGAAIAYRRLGADPFGPVTVSPPGLAVAAQGETPPVLEVLRDGTLVAAYPVSLPGHWKGEIRVQRSGDRGASWEAPARLHPARDGSHSHLSSAVGSGGDLVFAWLDNQTGGTDHMGLATAVSRDGRTFSAPKSLDPRTCECCGTALLARPDGTLRAAYRGLAAGDVRDLRLFALAADGGASGPGAEVSRDGWVLQGCPDTGPRLAEDPQGNLWTAWFTAGGGRDRAGVYAAVSTDGGKTFAPRQEIARSVFVKHPEIGLLPGGEIAVLYEAARPGGGHPLSWRVRDPKTGSWSAEREGPPGMYPRLAASPTQPGTPGQEAVAFTCRAGQGMRVVVTGWQRFIAGQDPAWGCDAGAPAEHDHG